MKPKFTGGIDAEALKRSANKADSLISDDDPVAWEPGWLDSFRRWGANLSDGETILLIFAEYPSILGNSRSCGPIFNIANEAKLVGGVYIVGRAVTSNGWQYGAVGDFQKACHAIATDSDLCPLPAVILGRKSGCMMYYRAGLLGEGDSSIEISLNKMESTLNHGTLSSALDVFAAEQLNSQEMRRQLWDDASKFIPKERAESIVQESVLIALRVMFAGYTTLAETNIPIGRTDLFMISKDEKDPARGLLELKVLRGFSSTGSKIAESVLKQHLMGGRIQARTYGNQLGACIRLLCSYDLRKDKKEELLNGIERDCEADGVTFKNYPVQNSSSNVRDALDPVL
ncbi:hypothetical protein [Burkholderia ambifaria]|uniref:hypothetical protein n=1 Tax=Burkholderia ambifaria TaxID=152480 RepID=UPI0015884D61|nr:hypothetical protein [Burkholderia ambifaria]